MNYPADQPSFDGSMNYLKTVENEHYSTCHYNQSNAVLEQMLSIVDLDQMRRMKGVQRLWVEPAEEEILGICPAESSHYRC